MKNYYLRPDFTTNLAQQTLAISATVATDPVRAALGSNKARLVSTVNCWILVNAPAAIGAGLYLPANSPEIFMFNPGDSISVIADSGTGKLNIVEMQG